MIRKVRRLLLFLLLAAVLAAAAPPAPGASAGTMAVRGPSGPLLLVAAAEKPDARQPSPDKKKPAGEIGFGANNEQIKTYASNIDVWKVQLSALQQMVDDKLATDVELRELPGILDGLRLEIRNFITELTPKRSEAQSRLDKLGPAPKEGEPEEAAEIAAQREVLGGEVATYDGLIKQAQVQFVKVGQIIDSANAARRDRFTRSLLEPVLNFYSPSLWRQAFAAVPDQMNWAMRYVSGWLGEVAGGGLWRLVAALFASLAAAALIWRAVRGLAPAWAAPDAAREAPPTVTERGTAAMIAATRSSAPLIGAFAAFYVTFVAAGLASSSADSSAWSVFLVASSAVFLIATIWHALLPAASSMRLLATDEHGSLRLAAIFSALIAVWAGDHLLTQTDFALHTPYPLIVLRSVTVAALIALLLIALLAVRVGPRDVHDHSHYRGWSAWLFLGIGLADGVIIFALVLGYAALARFAATQMVITGGVLALMYLLHLVGEYGLTASAAWDGEERAASEEEETGASPLGTLRIFFSLLFDIAILAVGFTILLLLWRFDWVEVKSWLVAAFFGLQIGGFTISLQSIVVALAVFAAGLVLTRVVQNWLLKRTQIGRRGNIGLRESLRTGIGYLGFILATIAAVSYLGIDFSNFAIVAGALSVGIGFGLQSIFNNFVSGLILLVERPIKVGDWITVGDYEGYVKKISVRSTEVETIHRQSVIIPNANLITETVTNWMHSDKVGRHDITVGVSYGTDVERLREVLLEVAAGHPAVLKKPAPQVHFANFGDSSLDFELRVFLRNIGNRIAISSELRYAIWSAFRDAGIEIPFPQRDLHVKHIADLEKLGVTRPKDGRAGAAKTARGGSARGKGERGARGGGARGKSA